MFYLNSFATIPFQFLFWCCSFQSVCMGTGIGNNVVILPFREADWSPPCWLHTWHLVSLTVDVDPHKPSSTGQPQGPCKTTTERITMWSTIVYHYVVIGSSNVMLKKRYVKIAVFVTDTFTRLRAHLHQVSASIQNQRCDDTSDATLNEINEVTPKWVATPFSSYSIDFNERSIASVIAVLMLTLGISGP